MQSRKDVWNKLSDNTKNFVQNYLKDVLKLSEKDFDNFLFPEFEKNILDAGKMRDMGKAVDRMITAFKNREVIAVFGDYDCDGVPGVALLRNFFEKLNYTNVIYYIPHRHTEGYGLNTEAIQKLKTKNNITLMITVDLGTTNIAEIDYANNLQIDTIVTDHHLPIENEDGQILPKAYAILNNKQIGCEYENKDLCGTGTVFKFILEILKKLRDENLFETLKLISIPTGQEKWFLDLVAIATIADMVSLTGENRTIAIYGLFVLQKTGREGLKTIFKNAKVKIQNINETEIAFTLAPRINSASRMSHPKIALSMFSTNLKEGIDAAHELESLNFDRKETTKNIMKSIYKTLDGRLNNSPTNKLPEILVIGNPDWNAGVLGILATKIVEKYNVSVFVFGGEEKNIFKGSCRSRGDVHLVKLMTCVKNNFEHFGGHELAGGFSISFKNLHSLENELNTFFEKCKIENKKEIISLQNTVPINLENISADFLDGLNLIAPFGVGNPKPIFQIKNISNSSFERFGKQREHLKVFLSNGSFKREAIKFFVDEKLELEISEKLKRGEIFFEIEAGFNTKIPRLKIVF